MLPKLTDNDPRRELPPAARRRIDQANIDGEVKVMAAMGEARREGQNLRKAEQRGNFEKASGVIQVVAKEFWAIGKRGKEFDTIMRDEIEGVSNSIQLNDFERRQLRLEVMRDYEFRDHDHEPATANPVKSEKFLAGKGNPELLRGRIAVSVKIAREYLGIGERAVQLAVQKKKLRTVGVGHNKQITTESLLKYLPPAELKEKTN